MSTNSNGCIVGDCNFNNFRKTFNQIDETRLHRKMIAYFVVIILTLPTDRGNVSIVLQEIVDDFYARDILNVVIIYNPPGDSTVYLFTYYPYMNGKCSQANLVIHNEIRNHSFVMKRPLFVQKLLDFHRCPLRIATFQIGSGEIAYIRNDNGSIVGLNGFEGRLIETIAEKLNFVLDIVEVPNGRGRIFPNGSASGALQLLQDGDADITIGLFYQRADYWSMVDFTVSYLTTDLCFVTSKGIRLSPFELLIAPFDKTVWFSTMCLLLTATIFFAFAQRVSPSNRQLNVLVLVRLAIGVDVVAWPNAFIARLLLISMSIIFLCLRTAYGTNLIYFLANEIRWPPIDTIDEMLKANYTFYATTAVRNNLLAFKHAHIQSHYNATNIRRQLAEDEFFRGAIAMLRMHIDDTMHASVENIYSYNICAYLRKNSYLTRTIDDVINSIVTGGMTVNWEATIVSDDISAYHPITEDHSPITLERAAGCFYLYAGMVAVACVILGAELIVFEYKKYTTETATVNFDVRRNEISAGIQRRVYKRRPLRSRQHIVFRSKYLFSTADSQQNYSRRFFQLNEP